MTFACRWSTVSFGRYLL